MKYFCVAFVSLLISFTLGCATNKVDIENCDSYRDQNQRVSIYVCKDQSRVDRAIK